MIASREKLLGRFLAQERRAAEARKAPARALLVNRAAQPSAGLDGSASIALPGVNAVSRVNDIPTRIHSQSSCCPVSNHLFKFELLM